MPPPPIKRRLTVAVRYDTELARTADPGARLLPRIEAASRELLRVAGITLEVRDLGPWTASGPARSAEGLLGALESEPILEDIDLVIAFSSALPPRRVRTSDLVRSRFAGRHLLARTLTPLFPRDPQALHEAEVLTLLHGLGRILGALPACSPGLMAESPGFGLGPRAWQFRPANVALLRALRDLDLRRPEGRISPEAAAAALKILEPLPDDLRCERPAADRRRGVLQAVAAPPTPPPPPPPVPADPALEAGLAALEAGDLATAFARCAPIASAQPDTPASRCAGMAAAGRGDRAAAIRFLRAHLAHQPGDGAALLTLAKQVGREGDDAAARALIQRFVDAHPEHLEARINLGVAHARLGDLRAARAEWEAVLTRDPAHPDARQLLAQIPDE